MIRQPGRLVALGSVVGRVTLRVPNLPSKGGDAVATGMELAVGGGFVVLASATRLGLPGALAGRVGTGPFAQLIREALERAGADVLLRPVLGEQGFSVCALESDGDRTFLPVPGVEAQLSEEDLAQVSARPDDAVLVQGFALVRSGTGEAVARWCGHEAGLGTAMLLFDPGPLLADVPDPV